MQPQDRKSFLEVVVGFAELKGKQLSAPALELFWHAMQDWSIEEFRKAAGVLIRTCEFMPTPADFHKLRQSSRPTAGEAWMDALSGHPDDPVAQRALKAATQGRYVGHIDFEELPWVQKRFVEFYEQMRDVEDTRAALPHYDPVRRLNGKSAGLLPLRSPFDDDGTR